MKISKSKAKDLYLLNDSDLNDLDVITKDNYLNREDAKFIKQFVNKVKAELTFVNSN